MGESSTCLMHSFSYTSGISSDTQEGSPMYGYGDSVSLGRFMTEPLAWERWSTFSRNRYVDEAKSYSKPGSVAQKKAYFEAHFKRMAALKAAALLEQQAKNNCDVNHYTNNGSPQQQGSSGIQAAAALLEKQMKKGNMASDDVDDYSGGYESTTTAATTQFVEVDNNNNECGDEEVYHDADEALTQKSSLSVEETTVNDQVAGVDVGDEEDYTEAQVSFMSPEPNGLKKVEIEESGSLGLPVNDDKPSSTSSDAEENVSSLTNVEPRTSSDAGESISTLKNDFEGKIGATSGDTIDDSSKHSSAISFDWGLAKADNILVQKPSSSNQDEVVVVEETTPIVTKTKNPPLSSFIPAVEVEPASPSSSPARPVRQQVIHPGKENLATPKKSSWLHHHETTDNKKRTPLRMTINREFNRLLSPVIKKIGSSSKSKASADRMADHSSEAPPSGRRRARALFDSSSASGSNAVPPVGPTEQITSIPSADGAKSPTITSRNKTVSAFCLRRRDKSAQKTNENAEGQQSSKTKGKKAKESNKLRHSFCFGARLSSESFRERDRDRSLRTSPLDNTTSTNENGTAPGSSIPPLKSALKTSHQKKTSQYRPSTSS